MILSRIIIRISKKSVTLSYVKDSEEAMSAPLPGYVWPMPLAKFGGARAESPEFAIGKGLDEKLQSFSVPGSEAGNVFGEYEKSELPVLVIAENDITDAGVGNIVSNLSRWGYDNVMVTRPDVIVTDYYNKNYSFENVVTSSSNGTDLSVSIFRISEPSAIQRRTFEGRSVDNRVDSVARLIWDQVKNQTFDLKIETEMDALRDCAEAYLKNPLPYYQGKIRLSDGDVYTYILQNKDLDTLPISEQPVEDMVTDFLLDNGIADRSKTVMVVRNDAIGSHYLEDALTKSFQTVAYEEGSVKDILDKFIAGREWDRISETPDQSLVKVKPVGVSPQPIKPPEEPPIGPYPGPGPEPPIPPVDEFIPVKLSARIEKVKTGLFKTKSTLIINIDPPIGLPLPWDSVLCVQEDPLTTIERKNVVKEYASGKVGPFSLKLDLPLRAYPKAKKLRIYFKPDSHEPVGINNAYDHDPLTVNID